MDKNLSFRIDHTKKIIYNTFKGRINLNDLQDFYKSKINSPDFNSKYSYIADIRGVEFELNLSDKEEMYKTLKGVSSINEPYKKCAIITSSPQEVVYSEMFQKNIKNHSSMKFKTFSTEQAAYQWVKEI